MKEVEGTLIVRLEHPEAVVEEIAALTSIVSYRLLSQGSRAIHDYYVDTPGRALNHAGLSLRVREIDATPYLTLKGPPRHIAPGLVERLEIEAPWSEETLARVTEELAQRGVSPLLKSQAFDRASPLELMARLGLLIIQHRENHRYVRDVVTTDTAAELVVAELAIDSVIYHLAAQKCATTRLR
jgi:uncharacterized protein YjbK